MYLCTSLTRLLSLSTVGRRRSFKPNMIVVVVSLCFSALNVGALLVEWLAFTPFAEYVALWYGVFIGYFSVR